MSARARRGGDVTAAFAAEQDSIRREDAKNFATLVSTLLIALELAPPDWQRRAVDIVNAAYPKPARPSGIDWQSVGTTTANKVIYK
jgi:hypothetical protein